MTKRKQKKKQQRKLPWQVILLLIIAAITYYFTRNADVTLYAVIGTGFAFIVSFVWKKVRVQQPTATASTHHIDDMTGVEFEEFLVRLFKRQGYRATMTKSSGDFGADLVVKGNGKTVVVQAKRYKSSVGVKAVQEIIAAIRMYDADDAWVVTNSYFTKQAKTLAAHNDVRLIDRDELMQMIQQSR